MNLSNEQYIVDRIKSTFQTAEVSIQREKRIILKIRKDLLPPLVAFLKDYLNFKHLSMISGVDWPEDNEIELVYHLLNYENMVHLMAKIRLNREKPEMETLSPLWDRAGTYERELHEMLGVDFPDHPDLSEFILEDWEGVPPMRRDFITKEYVMEVFEWRKGREDAKDVRTTISERYGEKLPDFDGNDQ